MRQSATILLVEDDQSMLNGMHDLLEAVDIGYEIEVLTASDGRVGLGRMDEQTPDLIVSDIMMPNMDGYQFLQKVREKPDWMHIPFIFLTAKGEKEEIREGRKSGADLYIVKPFNSSDLLELIESQLKKTFTRQVTQQQNVDALKKRVLQILNHEFRTPLTYVTAYYDMLAESVILYDGEGNFQGYLRGIQAGSIRLSRLIEDLIQVIELRTGETVASYRKKARPLNDVSALLEAAFDTYRGEADQGGVQVHYTPSEELPTIFGDQESLINIFKRVIDNAVKFTRNCEPARRNIYISAAAIGNEVHFVFEDEGVGFPKWVERQIFDLFFQYNRDLMEQQGAGVGLTITKGLVDIHQGRIDVQSRQDEGSKFTIVLPAYSGETQELSSSGILRDRRQEAIVLIVEDDTHLLEGLQELLEISDEKYIFRPLTATNGKVGLEVLSRNHPDLIISDIMMPEMGGFEFLENVRQNPDWVQIPFIFLSAKGEEREIHYGFRSGVEQYITKPYDSDELLEVIETQLERYYQVQGILTRNFDALKRSILNLITPDFRNPLSTVSEYSERLSQGFNQAQTEAELKDSLHGIQESSVRLARLVEDFIALAELRTGEAAAAFKLVAGPISNIGMLFNEAGHMCKDKEVMKDLQIHCTSEPNLPLVYGDGSKLQKIVERLIETGVRYFQLKLDEHINLSTIHIDGEIHLTIGYPISPDRETYKNILTILTSDTDEILDSHAYAPSLSIVKGYVDLHGGRFELKRDEAHGCTCTIILPTLPQTTSNVDGG